MAIVDNFTAIKERLDELKPPAEPEYDFSCRVCGCPAHCEDHDFVYEPYLAWIRQCTRQP